MADHHGERSITLFETTIPEGFCASEAYKMYPRSEVDMK